MKTKTQEECLTKNGLTAQEAEQFNKLAEKIKKFHHAKQFQINVTSGPVNHLRATFEE